jgi:hypothetical protein
MGPVLPNNEHSLGHSEWRVGIFHHTGPYTRDQSTAVGLFG